MQMSHNNFMAQKYVKEDSLPARKKERQNCFANFVAKIG